MNDIVIYFTIATVIFVALLAAYIFVPAKYYNKYISDDEIFNISMFFCIALIWPFTIFLIGVIILFIFLMKYREKVQSKYK